MAARRLRIGDPEAVPLRLHVEDPHALVLEGPRVVARLHREGDGDGLALRHVVEVERRLVREHDLGVARLEQVELVGEHVGVHEDSRGRLLQPPLPREVVDRVPRDPRAYRLRGDEDAVVLVEQSLDLLFVSIFHKQSHRYISIDSVQVFVSCRKSEQTWTASDPKPARRLALLLPADPKNAGIRVGPNQLVHHLVEPLDEHRFRIGGSPLQLALDVIASRSPAEYHTARELLVEPVYGAEQLPARKLGGDRLCPPCASRRCGSVHVSVLSAGGAAWAAPPGRCGAGGFYTRGAMRQVSASM